MYVLVEKVMNGTVEMSERITGYNAENFQDAVEAAKKLLNLAKLSHPEVGIAIRNDDENLFSFVIIQENGFSVFGRIENKRLEIINTQ